MPRATQTTRLLQGIGNLGETPDTPDTANSIELHRYVAGMARPDPCTFRAHVGEIGLVRSGKVRMQRARSAVVWRKH